jgi:hypothetical protein
LRLHRGLRHIEDALRVKQPIKGLIGCQQYILFSGQRALLQRFGLQAASRDEVIGVAEIGDELREGSARACMGIEARRCELPGADAAAILRFHGRHVAVDLREFGGSRLKGDLSSGECEQMAGGDSRIVS